VRTAVIDIGTNTLLLLIVDGQLRRIADECRFGRLGKGLDASGRIAGDAIARSLEICRDYRRLLDEHGVAVPRVIGTQALREAKNAGDFVQPAQQILRGDIEVIDGKREAQLAFLSVARTFPELANQPYVVVDVGGGSTELIATDGRSVTSASSVPIGAVRLTERFLAHDPPRSDELRGLEADIDRQLPPLPPRVPVIATAGTATTMAAVRLALGTYDPDAVTGLRMSPAALAAQYAHLATLTTAQRRELPGMEPQRADVIVAGMAIYARVVARIDAPVWIACDRGIRWGLAYEAISAAP
jgi:exopolyphosphatase/guanosine-5'-triphosphate,3'-diphosphate pyrophosphatase